MHWIYERVIRHNGLNYHLWSAEGDEGQLYALTRTSVIAPQNAPIYRSLQELAAKTGVPVVPLETGAASTVETATPPRIAIGLYRREDGWAQVDYGNRQGPIPRDLYEANGYEPAFDQLLPEEKYRAFQEVASKRRGAG
jgi:hypothetical protein